MAYSVFQNVKTVTVGGISITDPTSVGLEHDDAFETDATDGSAFDTLLTHGARVRRLDVNGRDIVSLHSALGESGSCAFTLQDGAGGADTTYTLGTGTGANFSFDSGETGALGSGSVSAIIQGAPS